MNVKKLIKKIENFKNNKPPQKGYKFDVEYIFSSKKHLFGFKKKSKDLYVFLKPSISDNLHHREINEIADFSVEYCKVNTQNSKQSSKYFVIHLKKTSLKEVFLEWVLCIIKEIDKKTTSKDIHDKILLYKLMWKSQEKIDNILMGLWCEIFIIYKSKNPQKLLDCWHETPKNKIDFTDKNLAVEVKSTKLNKRNHSTSYSQLYRQQVTTIIASFINIEEHTNGKSINDMQKSIYKKITTKSQNKFINIVLQTLGVNQNTKQYMNRKFNDTQALKSLDYFCPPPWNKKSIPNEINDLKFQIELTHAKAVKKSVLKKSKMFKSLPK